jgi:hypothetical protein
MKELEKLISKLESFNAKAQKELKVLNEALAIYNSYSDNSEMPVKVSRKTNTLVQTILAHVSKVPDSPVSAIVKLCEGKGYAKSSVYSTLSGCVERGELVNMGRKYRIPDQFSQSVKLPN